MNWCVHICQNGHVEKETRWIDGAEFCEKCGSKMIDRCPSCNHPIMEWDWGGRVVLGIPSYERASYCKHCGKPYPWTETALETATELIEEEETLDPVQRDNLVSSLPDLIAETPKTQVAVVRVKKFLTSAGKFTTDAIRQFVIDFGCELAKQQLGI